MNWLDWIIMLGFAGAFAAVLWVSRRNDRKLSQADRVTAGHIARQVRDYGPLSQAHVRAMAASAQAGGNSRENRMLAHGLSRMADEMRPGEQVTRSVPWWKRL